MTEMLRLKFSAVRLLVGIAVEAMVGCRDGEWEGAMVG